MTLTTVDHPMLWDNDTPRARRSDPATSQRAADKTQPQLSLVRERVLHILAYRRTVMDGNQINDVYRERFGRDSHFDTPRKRAGELVADGFLARDDEGLYSITDKGIAALTEEPNL